MTISLDDVLSAKNTGKTLTPAKRDTPWSIGGGQTAQAPIKLPEGSLLPSDPEVRQGLIDIATQQKINPALLLAMAHQESTYNANAVGPETRWGKAQGMFQFLEATANGHGIDPFDWKQAGTAAAIDLAKQIAERGVDWAVAHHHAGPNAKLHGPKTAEYTQTVLAKATAIARELGIDFNIPEGQKPDFSNVDNGTSKTISLDDVLASAGKAAETSEASVEKPTGEESFMDTLRSRASGFGVNPVADAVVSGISNTIERGWEGFQNFLNRETDIVERTDEELRRLWETEGSKSPQVLRHGMSFEQWAANKRTARVSTKPFAEEEAEWAERLKANPEDAHLLPRRLAHLRPKADDSRFAPSNTFKGVMQRFAANHRNPIDLMLQESIPADLVTYLFTLPELERKKFDQARAVSKAMEVTSNPDQYSAEEREAATTQVKEWRKSVDSSVAAAWDQMWQAAKEDPSAVLTGLSEALWADPYMAAAPIGVGMKPVRAVQAANKIGAPTIAGRAGKIADSILDGSITTAGINVAAGAADNLSEFGKINDSEAKLNAAIGALTGGALGPIFMNGARARMKSLDAHKAQGTLEEALRDAAKSDIEMEGLAKQFYQTEEEFRLVESALNKEESRRRSLAQERLNDLLGVRSEKDFDSWVARRRAEVKDWFKENESYADYQRYMAEERINKVEAAAAEREAAARRKAEAAYGSSPETAVVRQERLAAEFEEAVQARNAAEEAADLDAAWRAAEAEDKAITLAKQLDAEEMYYAQLSQDAPTIRQTEAKIARRNDALGRHRRKRGELGAADPETLARLSVVGAGAAAGLALFPEDEKLAGGLLGGLAGLLAPAGGSVLSRFRQAGAISSDGQIIAGLVKAGKMANKLDEAEIVARDQALVAAVRQGDQQAFKAIYEAYFGKMKRFADKFMRNRESSTGHDAEDIAQRAFMKLYEKISGDPEFNPDNLPAYITSITENEAKMAVRKSQSQREGADVVNESQYYKEDLYEGDQGSGRSILDDTTGEVEGNVIQQLPDTPESVMARNEILDIIRQALDGMPEKHQQLFAMTQLDHFDLKEAADQLGLTYDNARQIASRVEARVRNAVAENRRKLGEEPNVSQYGMARGQRGAASPELLAKTAAVVSLATAAGTAGYFLSDGDPWKSLVSGAGVGAIGLGLAKGKLRGSGNVIKGDLGGANPVAVAIRSLDYRLKDMSPALWGLAKKHGQQELRHIKEYNDATAEFIHIFQHLPKDIKPVIIDALSTRDKGIINKMLEQVGGKEFVEAFEKVRRKLDEVEDNLVDLGLIKKSEKDYFPFRVKDLDGLKAHLGKEVAGEIDAALDKAQRALNKKERGRPLTEIEKSIVINKVLEPYLGKPISAHTPGFAKARTIQRITPELQKFYHDPVATLNSYGVQSIKYIERAKFFGKHLKRTKNDQGNLSVNIGDSIGELVNDLKKRGEISDDQAVQLAGMLQDRFNGGEMASHRVIQGVKNLTNAMLLGHIASAAVQLGDILIQANRQGLGASVRTARRMLTRDKLVDLKNYGLTDHVAHEFLSDNWTRKVADWSFKWGGFRAVDHTGKNFGLNAAVEKMMKESQSPQGVLRLSDRFQRAFPEDFPKALSALKKGEVNEAVELLAFAELTHTQPVTSWELPQFYQRMPNGRIIYHLQTFSMRVMNMVYEDALKDLMSGNAKRTAKGAKALLSIGAVLGVQGVVSDKIKDFIAGKPIELSPEEIPVNALEALGMNLYDYNRIKDKGLLGGFVESKTPPIIRMSQDILNEPERSTRFVPVAGRAVYDRNKDYFEQRRRERRKKRGYKMEITVPPKKEGSSSSSGRGSRGKRGERSGR